MGECQWRRPAEKAETDENINRQEGNSRRQGQNSGNQAVRDRAVIDVKYCRGFRSNTGSNASCGSAILQKGGNSNHV